MARKPGHLRSHDTQTVSKRAFDALNQYALGKRGRPRYKKRGEIRSVEGKSNDATIRYRVGPVPAVHYSGLVLPIRFDRKDHRGWQARAMQNRVNYCRIVRRELRGDVKVWFGRGPSGLLLGPFNNSDTCLDGVRKDIDGWLEGTVAAWVPTAQNRSEDVGSWATVSSLSLEPQFPVWEVHISGGSAAYAVMSPAGVIKEYLGDWEEASNKATDLRCASETDYG